MAASIEAQFAAETELLGLKLLPGQESGLVAVYAALREMVALVGADHPMEAEPAHVFFAFGGADNQAIYLEGATSGTFRRFKAPYPGLIGPGGVRLPAAP